METSGETSNDPSNEGNVFSEKIQYRYLFPYDMTRFICHGWTDSVRMSFLTRVNCQKRSTKGRIDQRL